MIGLEIDFETRSDVNIKLHGAYRYFASPYTQAMMASYKINAGPLRRWRIGQPCPADIRAHVEAGGLIVAHNAGFERLLMQLILAPKFGWPMPKLEQFRCTAATAAAMALPRDLEGLGAALGLTVQKDKIGHRLMLKLSKPRKIWPTPLPPELHGDLDPMRYTRMEDGRVIEWWADPADIEREHDYCDTDVIAEAAADVRMVPLPDIEQELYWIDQRINDRGIRIDRTSAVAALKLAETAKLLLDKEIRQLTGGFVHACSQPGKIVEWVTAQGVELPSAAKADIEELLECDDIPPVVRRVVECRQEAAKTSVSKLKAFLNRANKKDRIQGAFLINAAGTGRWSSIGAQVHNLPRPRKEYGDAHLDLMTLFEAIRSEDPRMLKLLYGDMVGKPLHLISDAMRSFIWAAPGHELVVADYSGIEGAVAAWVANEHWKLEAMFALLADPSLPDLYRRAAAGIFNTTTDLLTKKDVRRQVGKVSELSLQFQGGVGAFRSMARNYSMKIEPVYDPVWEVATPERREAAEKRYDRCVLRGEATTVQLSRKAWLAAELVKVGWRSVHPAIVDSWALLQDAIRDAIERPGQAVQVLKVSYLVARGFLWCKLPSGRCLAYGGPKLKDQVWVKLTGIDASEVMSRDEAEMRARRGELTIEGPAKKAATALGVNSVTKKWERFALYGGLAFENIVQAIARDILRDGIMLAEANGYPVVGHVHDEIISELPKGQGDVAFFEKLISQLRPEYAGMPLASSGWRGKRYRKD